ncbi:MAG: ABC transporter ATP-binding protein [Candidatus Korarchaeota archaeon]|nr:ABC transporter ATP-binding protein [Candidatus Korarchaeota archaeon]
MRPSVKEDTTITVAVEIVDVSKKYGHIFAIKPFSIKLDEGETVAVLGPNGAGKSTLMKILATHVLPSSGIVKIYGRNVFKDGENARKRIGFVTHESFLYDELSVEENLQFYRKFFSVDQEDIREIIEFLNLKSWRKVPAKQLSYGLRKRADIARALIHDPDLILLDELFAGLDEETRNFLVDYFQTLQGKTLLVSSHSVQWAKQLCNRSLFLDKGNLVKDTFSG